MADLSASFSYMLCKLCEGLAVSWQADGYLHLLNVLNASHLSACVNASGLLCTGAACLPPEMRMCMQHCMHMLHFWHALTAWHVPCRLVALGNDPLVAVSAPRLHHQLLPDTVTAEQWAAGRLSLHVDHPTVQVGIEATRRRH